MRAVHIALTGDKSSSERTDDTCDIRADSFAAGDPFKASEDCVVVEGSALDNDILSECLLAEVILIRFSNRAFLMTE